MLSDEDEHINNKDDQDDNEETEEEDVEEKSESNKKALNVRSRKPRTKIVDRDRALAIVRAAAS